MRNEDLSLDFFCGPVFLKRFMQCVSVRYQHAFLAQSSIEDLQVCGSPKCWDALTQLGWLEEKLRLLDWARLFLFCISPFTKLNAYCATGKAHTSVYGFSYIPWISQQVLLWFVLLCKCYLYHRHIHEKSASSVSKHRTLLECALMLW